MRGKAFSVLLAGLMLVLGFSAAGSLAPSAVAAPAGGKTKRVMTPTDFSNAIQLLQEQARRTGVTISDLRFDIDMRSGKGGRRATPAGACTLTATVGAPGADSLTISPTADTCAEAAKEAAATIAGLDAR